MISKMIKNTVLNHNTIDDKKIEHSTFFINAPIAMLLIDKNGAILFFNRKFTNLFEDSVDTTTFNFIINSFRDHESFIKLQSLISLLPDFTIESIWKKFSSGYLYLIEHYQKLQDNQYLVYLEDNSEKHKLKRWLDITIEKFKFINDQLPVGIYRIVATGEIVFANHQLASLLGFSSSDELTGCLAKEVFNYPANYEQFINNAIKQKKTRYTIEYCITNLKGKTIWIQEIAHIFYDTSDEVLFFDGTIHDITDRKIIEQQNKRLLTAFNQLSEAIIVTDTRGFIMYANPAAEKITGYSIDEMLGMNMNMFRSGIHSKEFFNTLWHTILSGVSWEGTIINRRKNGELFTEYMVITPVKNDDGHIINFVAVKRDLTDIIKLEEQLRHSQKLQAIGTLAGGIAHDFNNILMGMQLYTEVLMKKYAHANQDFELLEKIYYAQNRAKELIKQILLFSRPSLEEKSPLQVHLVVKEIMKLIQGTFPTTISIIQKINDCGTLLANPAHIHQIVMNLCTNAYDAMQGHGQITVELKRLKKIVYPDKSEKSTGHDWIVLIIEDNGCGIDDTIKTRIFDPFFTTKKVGEGTGLGLSTIHGIVKEYGGEIFFVSEVGKGTTFYTYLPAL